ncbi:MAG: hypothetical protein K0S47_4454 [Herbinix sp.]|nr:hypothetical protein [Herbinix sp.]
MKRAESGKKGGDHAILCNVCGKNLKVENGILKEDAFEATKEWGYFSKRDMEIHHFNICEECYEKMIAGFQIPVEVEKKLEAL